MPVIEGDHAASPAIAPSASANAAAAESVRHWFLGYVEGKTDVTPPPFWAEAVTTFRLNRVEVRGEELFDPGFGAIP